MFFLIETDVANYLTHFGGTNNVFFLELLWFIINKNHKNLGPQDGSDIFRKQSLKLILKLF